MRQDHGAARERKGEEELCDPGRGGGLLFGYNVRCVCKEHGDGGFGGFGEGSAGQDGQETAGVA